MVADLVSMFIFFKVLIKVNEALIRFTELSVHHFQVLLRQLYFFLDVFVPRLILFQLLHQPYLLGLASSLECFKKRKNLD